MAAPSERWECPNCGTPLNIAALGIYAKVACPACGHVDHVHTLLANFRIEGVLGLGGMSVVLRARDLVLERPLAIKLLNEFYRDQPERMARFEQECELMAKVRHENVVSLYSAGRVRGQFYIAMELINGHNLEELVRQDGPMDPIRALDVLREVVQGLQAACKAGLLHRDMKPANILICEDGHAKVLDFGLSHGKRDANTEEIIWATPYYVPPETLMREPEDVRTDIYALGMTLRHLLTGQQNFEPAPEGIEEMLACKRALPRMAESMPSLPEVYCDLVDHMTAYDPANRPDDYASLLEEITEVRAALVAEHRGLPFSLRLRQALPVLGGAVAALTLGAGGAAVTARLSTPAPELLYARPTARLAWPERDTLASAHDHLKAGRTQEAAELFASLAHSEAEAAAGAWAALHASVLAFLHGEDADELRRCQSAFAAQVQKVPASAGQEAHAQLASLLQTEVAPGDPFLQAAWHLRQLASSMEQCQPQAEREHMAAARSALRRAGGDYAALLQLLEQWQKECPAKLPERLARRYENMLSSLNLDEAARVLALMQETAGDEPRRARLAVQQEAFSLYTEAAAMMQRRRIAPAPGELVTPERLPELLETLHDARLSRELLALLHMARGEFESAAACYSAAVSPDAAEPFDVLMNDWLRRVR